MRRHHESSFLASSLVLASTATVRYEPTTRVFRLDSSQTTYAFGISSDGKLQPLYWGGALAVDDPMSAAKPAPPVATVDPTTSTTPQEFAGWGQGLYTEPSLKITDASGDRDLELRYVSHELIGDTIRVLLKDIVRDVFVQLRYQMDAETGILARSAVIQNRSKERIVVDQAASGNWTLPMGGDYTLRYLAGRWGGETNLYQQPIQPGTTVLESRRGTTGHQNNPWVAIQRGSGSDEDAGDVWFPVRDTSRSKGIGIRPSNGHCR